jgi:hypothetical protein
MYILQNMDQVYIMAVILDATVGGEIIKAKMHYNSRAGADM